MITIVLPTITGREHWLERCQQAYADTTDSDFTFVIVKDAPTWGDGINLGTRGKLRGRYLHFTADDIQPHQAWDVAAIEAVDNGYLPAPRILNPDLSLQSFGAGTVELPDWTPTEFSRVPFMSWTMWQQIGPMPNDLHYYADNWISHRGRLAGWQTVVRRDYLLTHHWAPEGRIDHRFASDGARYQELIA